VVGPVVGLSDRPTGNPVSTQLIVPEPPVTENEVEAGPVAGTFCVVAPFTENGPVGSLKTIGMGFDTVDAPESQTPMVAVIATEPPAPEEARTGVPVIWPVDELMERPVGRLLAVKLK
jgi:hypothetical protein